MYSNTRLYGMLASCLMVIITGIFPAYADEMGTIEPKEAAPFPAISYKDGQDQTHQLKQDSGKLTIVHFWATWCVPCVGELPLIDALQKTYGAKGLKIIDISEDGTNKMAVVKDFFAKHSIVNLTPYIDIGNDAFHAAGGRGLPTSYFIDDKGQKIALSEGPVDWKSKEVKEFIEARLHK